jgi:hypothetical protein
LFMHHLFSNVVSMVNNGQKLTSMGNFWATHLDESRYFTFFSR